MNKIKEQDQEFGALYSTGKIPVSAALTGIEKGQSMNREVLNEVVETMDSLVKVVEDLTIQVQEMKLKEKKDG